MKLKVENLMKSYNGRKVVKDVSLEVNQGEIVGLLGPNGAGKTTSFYMTVGLIKPNGGTIYLDDKNITNYPMYKRAQSGIGYLAQEASVFRKLSIEDNILSVLQMTKLSKKEQIHKMESLIDEFSLGHIRTNRGDLLSGGERRRTEIARALATDPSFILLDEPFSHIDNFKKQSLRRSVFKYLKEHNITCIVATHDKEDVLPYADNMIVLENKEVLVEGCPAEIYNNPKHPVVAAFFGNYSIINKTIYYAHQIFVVRKSSLEAVTKQSFYMGSFYLIEAEREGSLIYFNHTSSFPENTFVYLKLK